MNKLIALLLVLGFLAGAAQARSPMVGDHVIVSGMIDGGLFHYEGNITDITEGLICLNCTKTEWLDNGKVITTEDPYDICLGLGTINALIWV